MDHPWVALAGNSPRTIHFIKGNSEARVRRATRRAFATRSERKRLEALLELRGVSVPMASALLMLLNEAVRRDRHPSVKPIVAPGDERQHREPCVSKPSVKSSSTQHCLEAVVEDLQTLIIDCRRW